ncbi:hypothetical protein ACLOJK_037623 [Asimina triloba]
MPPSVRLHCLHANDAGISIFPTPLPPSRPPATTKPFRSSHDLMVTANQTLEPVNPGSLPFSAPMASGVSSSTIHSAVRPTLCLARTHHQQLRTPDDEQPKPRLQTPKSPMAHRPAALRVRPRHNNEHLLYSSKHAASKF